jgi:hypothetical protein
LGCLFVQQAIAAVRHVLLLLLLLLLWSPSFLSSSVTSCC